MASKHNTQYKNFTVESPYMYSIQEFKLKDGITVSTLVCCTTECIVFNIYIIYRHIYCILYVDGYVKLL